MWRRVFLGLICVVSLTSVGWSQPAPQLSEVQRLKAENLKLQFALLQQQEAQLREAAAKLEERRLSLEAEFRTTLSASPEASFNWNTFSFDKPQTAAPSPGGAPPPSAANPPGARQ